ncbi:MAG: tetratricopeptide repeat protein [Desulfobacterales bacterium]|nr:tetratricopeptide repeat protein [Desulfobacterales bacterium]
MTAFEPAQILQSMTAKPGVGGVYRPVAYFTLALNWLLGQDDVFGYHVVNFIIHVLTTMALFFTIRVLLRTPRLDGCYPGGQRTFIAGSAALLWALNPVQTQAVTYIVQRMASLAALFAVLALYFYLKARLASGPSRRAGFHLAALICFILGLLSKENVVLLPLAVPVLEAFFFSEIQFRGRGLMKVALGVGLAVLFCVGLGLFLRPDLIDFIIHYYDNRPFTLVERLLSEQRILLFYLSLLLFPAPWRLSVEHDIVLSTSLFSPWTTAAAIGGNALLIAGAIKMGRKHPLTALAVLFFYLNHVVESTILPLELIFEHRNYLPSVFLFLPVAQAVNYLVIKWQDNRLRFTGTIVLTAALLGFCGYATHVRNQVWRSEQALWLDALAKAPNSARPMATLAILLAWGDDPTPAKYRKALELTERALSLRMARNLEAEQLGNMASIYERLGETEQALAYYQKALKVAPERVNNRYNLAKTLAKNGLFERARRELEIILEQGAVHADYFALLGLTHLWQTQPEQALTIFRKALKLAPGRPDILLAIGNSLSAMGYYERAQWFIRQAQKAGGHDMVVVLNLLQNALAAGDMAMARKTLDQMLARYPLPMILDLDRLSAERYRNVPLQIGRLQAFITSEIHNSQFSSEQ